MARPTKLTQELKDSASQYLELYSDIGHLVPSVQGLARYLKVAESSIYKWADEDEAFSGTLADIKTYQLFDLMNGGLSGDLNATIAKLMLANHGHSDKVDTTLSGGDKPIETDNKWTVEFVNATPESQ